MSNINTMVDRTGEILDYLYRADDAVGVSKLASDLDLPKATAFRILTTLEKWGIVEKQYDSDRYKLGMILIKYGAKVSAKLNLVELSAPIIDRFSKEIGESISLSVEHLGYSLTLYRSHNTNSILASRLIPMSSLNCSASGKIFLSIKTDAELRAYFDGTTFEKRTAESIIDADTYLDARKKIKETDIAFDNEEYEYGLTCISSPIRHHGSIVAALSISGPKSRLELKGMETLKEKLQGSTEAISKLVDYLDKDSLY